MQMYDDIAIGGRMLLLEDLEYYSTIFYGAKSFWLSKI
jgi:hypothetical protein